MEWKYVIREVSIEIIISSFFSSKFNGNKILFTPLFIKQHIKLADSALCLTQ